MASEGSDTDMSSSSSANSESSDSARSWGDDSSEGSGSAQPPAAAAAARRVPPLALGGNLAALSSAVAPHGEEDNRGPGTARQAGPRLVPRLSLPSAAAAAAVSAAAPAPASARRLPSPPRRPAAAAMQHRQEHQQVSAPQRQQEQEQEQQTRAASQAALVSLDILSPAFSVEQGEQAGSSINGRQQLAQRCASKLGVPADRLRYYALVEVSGPQDLPPDCARAAVEVVGSSFSLSAMEELVAENKRLKTAMEEVQEQGHAQPPGDWQRSGNAGAVSAAEVQELQARLRELQLESDGLRQQLRQSESLRRKGQKTLQELKHEFDALSRALMLGHASGMVLGRQRPLHLSPPEPESRIGTPAAVSDALQQL